MATQVITNPGHDDMIHDAVLDYYGRRLATCSSDKTIKIFDVEGDTHKLTETLRGHEGAVWCVSWAHPKHGTILASSSYDGKVLIWREQNGQWTKVADFAHHSASVNIVSWSPHESGCLLACASSDGRVSVLEFQEGNWTHQIFEAHVAGVNSVSWAPAIVPGTLTSNKPDLSVQRRFVTGGSDGLVKLWDWSAQEKSYLPTKSLSGHTDWVRDVAWSPSVILGKSYIASGSQDKTVRIWSSMADQSDNWTSTVLNFEAVVWTVNWSPSGNVLAVATGDNKVSLWKENVKGDWYCEKWVES